MPIIPASKAFATKGKNILAFKYEENKYGVHGLNMLNLFTDDEIFCSDFTPSQNQIKKIAKIIREINSEFYGNEPVILYIAKGKDLYAVDMKLFHQSEPIFADAQSPQLGHALSEAKQKLFRKVPRPLLISHQETDSSKFLPMAQ